MLNGYTLNPLQIVEYLIEYAKSIVHPTTYQENFNIPKDFVFSKSDSLLYRIKMIIYYLCDIYGYAGKAIELRSLLYNSYIFPEIQSYLTRNFICDPLIFFNQMDLSSQNIYLWNQFFKSRNNNKSECKELMIYILECSLKALDSSKDICQLKQVVSMIGNINESFNAQFTPDELKLVESIKKTLSDVEKSYINVTLERKESKLLEKDTSIPDHSKWIDELFNFLYEPIVQKSSIRPQSQVKHWVNEWEVKFKQSNPEQFMTATVNAMNSCNNEKVFHSHDDFVEDPLLLFKFNSLILSYPIVFKSIFLKVSFSMF